MKIMFADGSWSAWVAIVVLVLWRVVVPIVFTRRANKKGYNYYLFALLGIFISPLLCILLTYLLPDKTEQERMRMQVAELESEVERLRAALSDEAGSGDEA